MIEVPIFQVDAFTSTAFGGNPAAICPLEDFLTDSVMQSIARENNLSETAFIVPVGDDKTRFHLRWFTPTLEVDLCGHATLGAAYVVLTHLFPDADEVAFETRSGLLTVTRDNDCYAMTLPNLTPEAVDAPDGLAEAMGAVPSEVLHRGRDFLIVYDDPDVVKGLNPDMRALTTFDPFGFIATAPATDGVDFISRCFFPNHGIAEDPVTGSAHCLSAPYWADRLDQRNLHALQVSERGGELWIDVADDMVTLKGQVVETMRGTLMVS